MKLVKVKRKCRLKNLPAGAFFTTEDESCIAFKSEYHTHKGAVEAFIHGSGEMFWGGTSSSKEQRELLVYELKLVTDER